MRYTHFYLFIWLNCNTKDHYLIICIYIMYIIYLPRYRHCRDLRVSKLLWAPSSDEETFKPRQWRYQGKYQLLCSNLLSTIPHFVVINNLTLIYLYIYIYIYICYDFHLGPLSLTPELRGCFLSGEWTP